MIDHHHHTGPEVAGFALPLLRGETPPPLRQHQVEEVAEGIRRAGVTAIALKKAPPGWAPPALIAALEKERDRLRADLALLYDRLGRLADSLGAAGIRFILLKGAALAPLLYGSPEERPMVDIDLLIRRRDWPAARAALGREGYRFPDEKVESYWLANYYNMAVGTPGPAPSSLDLHWGLCQPIRYRVDEDGLWSRSVPFRLDGREHLRLGDEDLLLSLVLHIAYHYFDARLLWLHDIHLLCRKTAIDWDSASSRAKEWGMGTVFGLALAYVEKVFPGTVPAEVLSAGAPRSIRAALLAPLRSAEPDCFFRGDDRRFTQLIQGILVMDSPLAMARFGADKIARRLRFLGRRPRLR